MKKMNSNMSKIMNILKKEYNYTRKTTLNRMKNKKTDSFKILISCLISLRTKDENTEKVVKKLFLEISTPKELAEINIKKLEKLIYSSGHYKKKARTLKHISNELINKFNSKVPDNKEKLLSIKGIGPKTANVVLCFAFNQTVIPVDINVHRISNRLAWVNTKTPEKTELELEKILPKKYWREINGLFILHGKTTCVPISPFCSICPVNKLCPKVEVKKFR